MNRSDYNCIMQELNKINRGLFLYLKIYQNDHPIGFIQYYCLTEHFPEGIQDFNHPLFKSYQSNELVGMDLFVAQQENRGIGLGERILNHFILKLPASIKAVIVDPDSNNNRAIRCYIKAGFQSTNYSKDKAYRILLKILHQVSENSLSEY